MDDRVVGAGLHRVFIRLDDSSEIRAYGAVDFTGDAQVETIDIPGDDIIIARFLSQQTEEITLSLNAISFDALAAITGNTYSSSATGLSIPFGTNSELNPPYIEIQGVSQAKNTDGTVGWFYKRFFKAQLAGSPTITQQNGAAVSVEIPMLAIPTETDILGTALTEQMIGETRFETGANPVILPAVA